MAAKKTAKSANSFEQNLNTLEALVEKLEQGELPLEQALQEFELGIKLARECQTALKNAEQKVQILMEKHAAGSASDYLQDTPDSDPAENETDDD